MKLLVQSDDYGISRAVSRGIIYGIEKSMIRNTGIFTNMPWFEECAGWISEYQDRIALGIDLNISTGPAILSHEQIPTITKEDGTFFSSSQLRKKTDEIDMDDVRKEFSAQIERYELYFGRSPDYIHPHAVFDERIIAIERELACKYGTLLSGDVWKKMGCPGLDEVLMPWYKYPATYENQLASSLKEYILSSLAEWEKNEYALIVCHAGYVDMELMGLSSFNLLRMKDLEGVTDEEVIKQLNRHNVELIDYKMLS